MLTSPHTFIIHYADELGTLHSARLTTDNGDMDERVRAVRFSEIFERWGWDCLSVQRVDEITNEVQAPSGRKELLIRKGYRMMIGAALMLNMITLAMLFDQGHELEKLDRFVTRTAPETTAASGNLERRANHAIGILGAIGGSFAVN